MLKIQIFLTYLYQNHTVISTHICNFWRSTSNINYNESQISGILDIFFTKLTLAYRPIFYVVNFENINDYPQKSDIMTYLYQNYTSRYID